MYYVELILTIILKMLNSSYRFIFTYHVFQGL